MTADSISLIEAYRKMDANKQLDQWLAVNPTAGDYYRAKYGA